MTGDDSGSDPTYDQPRVPAALRDRVTGLFVDYRGYEPASFQESLSLVADLAAAQIDDELDGPEDSVPADGTERSENADGRSTDAAGRSADADVADADGSVDPIAEVTAEVTDDVADDTFETLDQQPTRSATADDGEQTSASVSVLDDGGLDADSDAGTLHANPESSCALCGDVHRVSALQTTILDGTGSVALICPDCVE